MLVGGGVCVAVGVNVGVAVGVGVDVGVNVGVGVKVGVFVGVLVGVSVGFIRLSPFLGACGFSASAVIFGGSPMKKIEEMIHSNASVIRKGSHFRIGDFGFFSCERGMGLTTFPLTIG